MTDRTHTERMIHNKDQQAQMGQAQICGLDLLDAQLLEICVALNEYDLQKKPGLRFETWPDEIKRCMERALDAWKERNPKARVLAMTTGIANNNAILILHWRPAP